MGAIVNYNNVSPKQDIYGLYDDFVALVDSDSTLPKNLTYEVTVTVENDSGIQKRSVTPIGTIAIVEPFKLVQDTYFKSEYNGFTEHSNKYGYAKVTISVQEFSSSSEAIPPTSTGAAVSNTFYVYNGYENGPVGLNYRNPNWYNTTPIKLPKVKKDLRLLTDDVELLTFPSEILLEYGFLVPAKYLITEFKDDDGNIISTSTIDLTFRLRTGLSLVGVGYWNIDINFFLPPGSTYSESKIRYETQELEIYDSEIVTIRRAECNPKNERYRLYWINRYGGAEYQNFELAAETTYQSRKGKRIQSDGINYSATSFVDIQNINNPNIQEFGNSTTKEITIRTDYFEKQAEIDSLSEVLKSTVLIMFDSNNVAYPMILKDTNYNNKLLKEGLVKLEMTLQYANNEHQQIR